jgi:hypothetical protein
MKHNIQRKRNILKNVVYFVNKARKRLCGINAINNAFGKEIISVADMNSMIRKLSETDKLTKVKPGIEDIGDVSLRCLNALLRQKHITMKRLKNSNKLDLNAEEVHNYVQSNRNCHFIILCWSEATDEAAHYLAINDDSLRCCKQLKSKLPKMETLSPTNIDSFGFRAGKNNMITYQLELQIITNKKKKRKQEIEFNSDKKNSLYIKIEK